MGLKKILIKSKQGSALLTTLFIISAMSVFVASMSRLAFDQIKATSRLEDSSMAYAAAEAGIEDGLLRWRYNHNIQLPLQAGVDISPLNNLKAVMVNITQNKVEKIIDSGYATTHKSPKDSVYELKIWYKGQKIDATNTYNLSDPKYPYKLYKDQTLELDVTNLRGQIITFNYQTVGGDATRIETRMIATNALTGVGSEVCTYLGGDGQTKQCKQLSQDNQTPLQIAIPNNPADSGYKLRIKPLIFTNSGGTRKSAADTSYIAYTITPPNGTLVDMGFSTIQATGYYGDAKRTLVATVNRTSGTVIGIYDYAVYSGDPNSTLSGPVVAPVR